MKEMTMIKKCITNQRLNEIINRAEGSIEIDENGNITEDGEYILHILEKFFLGHIKAEIYEIEIPYHMWIKLERETGLKLV